MGTHTAIKLSFLIKKLYIEKINVIIKLIDSLLHSGFKNCKCLNHKMTKLTSKKHLFNTYSICTT